MLKTRPCKVCRKWFLPDPHVGNLQKVCQRPGCQRERHRLNCREWHEQEEGAEREERLVKRIRKDGESGTPGTWERAVSERLDWKEVRDSVGLEASVIIREYGREVLCATRDSVHSELAVIKGELSRHILRER